MGNIINCFNGDDKYDFIGDRNRDNSMGQISMEINEKKEFIYTIYHENGIISFNDELYKNFNKSAIRKIRENWHYKKNCRILLSYYEREKIFNDNGHIYRIYIVQNIYNHILNNL